MNIAFIVGLWIPFWTLDFRLPPLWIGLLCGSVFLVLTLACLTICNLFLHTVELLHG